MRSLACVGSDLMWFGVQVDIPYRGCAIAGRVMETVAPGLSRGQARKS